MNNCHLCGRSCGPKDVLCPICDEGMRRLSLISQEPPRLKAGDTVAPIKSAQAAAAPVAQGGFDKFCLFLSLFIQKSVTRQNAFGILISACLLAVVMFRCLIRYCMHLLLLAVPRRASARSRPSRRLTA